MNDELLGIGAFAMLSGLTVTALRHYDDVGLLRPAAVNGSSRYRYYSRNQVSHAVLVRQLRDLDLPVEEVRRVIEGRSAEAAVILHGHRDRLEARADRIRDHIATLDLLIKEGVTMSEVVGEGNRIVMLNIHVSDLEASQVFYEALLEVEFVEDRHGDGSAHLDATFGEWNTPSWFLVSLWPDVGLAGAADIGLLVADLNGAHRRALDAGGREISPPCEVRGMPRNAQVADPSGNRVGLYQA